MATINHSSGTDGKGTVDSSALTYQQSNGVTTINFSMRYHPDGWSLEDSSTTVSVTLTGNGRIYDEKNKDQMGTLQEDYSASFVVNSTSKEDGTSGGARAHKVEGNFNLEELIYKIYQDKKVVLNELTKIALTINWILYTWPAGNEFNRTATMTSTSINFTPGNFQSDTSFKPDGYTFSPSNEQNYGYVGTGMNSSFININEDITFTIGYIDGDENGWKNNAPTQTHLFGFTKSRFTLIKETGQETIFRTFPSSEKSEGFVTTLNFSEDVRLGLSPGERFQIRVEFVNLFDSKTISATSNYFYCCSNNISDPCLKYDEQIRNFILYSSLLEKSESEQSSLKKTWQDKGAILPENQNLTLQWSYARNTCGGETYYPIYKYEINIINKINNINATFKTLYSSYNPTISNALSGYEIIMPDTTTNPALFLYSYSISSQQLYNFLEQEDLLEQGQIFSQYIIEIKQSLVKKNINNFVITNTTSQQFLDKDMEGSFYLKEIPLLLSDLALEQQNIIIKENEVDNQLYSPIVYKKYSFENLEKIVNDSTLPNHLFSEKSTYLYFPISTEQNNQTQNENYTFTKKGKVLESNTGKELSLNIISLFGHSNLVELNIYYDLNTEWNQFQKYDFKTGMSQTIERKVDENLILTLTEDTAFLTQIPISFMASVINSNDFINQFKELKIIEVKQVKNSNNLWELQGKVSLLLSDLGVNQGAEEVYSSLKDYQNLNLYTTFSDGTPIFSCIDEDGNIKDNLIIIRKLRLVVTGSNNYTSLFGDIIDFSNIKDYQKVITALNKGEEIEVNFKSTNALNEMLTTNITLTFKLHMQVGLYDSNGNGVYSNFPIGHYIALGSPTVYYRNGGVGINYAPDSDEAFVVKKQFNKKYIRFFDENWKKCLYINLETMELGFGKREVSNNEWTYVTALSFDDYFS